MKALGNIHSQARVSNGEMDLLNSLGEQLQLDPEMAKLLNAEGELPADFEAALKEMSFEDAQKLVDTLNSETDMAGATQARLNQQLQELLPGNVERLGTSQSQKDLQALLSKNNPAQTQVLDGDQALNLKNAKNAEDASKAFMPERKSIFAGQQQAQQPQQGKNAQQAQNTQGLVDLNQFMAQQSQANKNRALSSQYKNEQQSMFSNKAFMEKQMPNVGLMASTGEAEMSSLGEFGHGQDQLLAQKANAQGAAAGGKVFDLGTLTKSGDIEAVISQIQDYVTQAKAAKEPSAQMSFKHPELGDVDIFVRKGAGEQVHVTIGSHGQEAAKFFKQHQGELLQTLQNSGVQVGEFKLESSSTKDGQNNQNNEQKQQFANQQNKSNQEQQRKEDSHRREELWELLNKDERKSA